MCNNGSVILVTVWKVSAIWFIIELVFLSNIENTTQYVVMEEKCSKRIETTNHSIVI